MQWKAALLLILFNLCLGCTSEQWVKEYVKGETTGLQEALNRYTANTGKRQEELEKKLVAMEGQITEMRASGSQEALDRYTADTGKKQEELEKKLVAMEGQITEMRATLGTTDRYPKEEEILNLRAEMEKGLSGLKESQSLDYTSRGKELNALTTTVSDAKRFVDMNVGAMLKAQSLLKEFIIEEVRTLRVERQEYARELESIKGRLQAIEDATGKKGTSGNESRQQTP
ncbi:MAG: hypothetical protein HZA70_05695 [Planctomycetes bacterium]|nr:hypothetical protein [Planctomycetota bacterium]